MSGTKTNIGFAGLGQMGKHMARNLLGPDVALTVCARRRTEVFDLLEQAGATATTDARDMAGCDIVFLCLPGDEAVKSLLLGQSGKDGRGGLLSLLVRGCVIVDCSTTSYTGTKEIAAACAEKGVEFVDAPISGMEARARNGTLSIMAGGKAETLDRVRPFLERMGNTIVHVGEIGCGQLTKLVNQLLFNINIAALAEILPMAVALGLDPVKTGEIVNSGTGRSYASEFFIPRILENSFSEGYPLQNAYKDIVSAMRLSAAEGIPLPVLQAAAVTYQNALRKGYGHEDKGAMIKVQEDLLGALYRK